MKTYQRSAAVISGAAVAVALTVPAAAASLTRVRRHC